MEVGDQRSEVRGRGSATLASLLLRALLWLPVAALMTVLCLRFGMRAVGVRDDIPLPGLVYALTNPLVAPFYRFFPADTRLDYPVMEAASLAAAGVVLAIALAAYVVWLLASARDY